MAQKQPRLLSGGVIQTGVDWMTVTAQDNIARLEMGVLARRCARKQTQEGNMVRPWSSLGYSGFQTNGIQWGEREDSTIVRLSSDLAHEDWYTFYQVSSSVTRVDWEVTVRIETDPQKLVLEHARVARAFWRKRKDGPTITLTVDDRSGATLYLGKRSSNIMVRIYNKHAESKQDRYDRCIRYEVELKDVAARTMMRQLVGAESPPAALLSSVHEMIRVRGVSPAFAAVHPPLRIQWPKRPVRYRAITAMGAASSGTDSKAASGFLRAGPGP